MPKQNFNRFIFLFLLSSFFWGITSCNFQQEEKKQMTEESGKNAGFLYDLASPDTVFQLPSYLKEISGISYFQKDKIACVQDEEANIYIFDIQRGEVISEFDFGKNGDYEDIAIVKNDAYVLRSDGTLFKVEDFEANPKKAIKIKTALGQKNNTEGLVYDENTNSLLIACKDSPSIDEEKPYTGFKAIYRFDLELETLIEKPAYLIDFSKIDSAKVTGSVADFFTEAAIKLKLSDGSNFFPSAIAIHPLDTEKIYLISNIGKSLVIMNRSGDILRIINLDSRVFNQPEGICFSENGDLFISNEAVNGGGNILKFKLISNTLKKN